MRTIDWDKPLSKDDKAWLAQRMTPELEEKIKANEERDFEEAEVEDDDETAEFEDDYDSWKVAELKAEAEKRELDMTGMTKKQELIAALRTWDAANPDPAA